MSVHTPRPRAAPGGEEEARPLPLEGWARFVVHGQLDSIGPSDRHPDIVRLVLAVPPPTGPGEPDERVEALADQICRIKELGVPLADLEAEAPHIAAGHRELAEQLLPWLLGAPERDRQAAWAAGHRAGMERGARGKG